MEDLGLNLARSYEGRRVLVTGHTGFKGSWLSLWLAELGADVHGFALPPEPGPGNFKLSGVHGRIHHHEGDVRDFGAVRAAFEAARPELVFHLAAQALVRPSYDDPKTTFDVNVGGTINVLECTRHAPSVRAAIIVTSDKCYENREWSYAYRENDALGGRDPYSASKGAAEIVVSSYSRSFFSDPATAGMASVRAGNVIGGGDWAKDRVIADCVRALTAAEPVVVRNPSAVRPWQHVLEPLCGYLTLGVKLLEDPRRFGEAYNFGPDLSSHVEVKELVETFIHAWGEGSIVVPTGTDGRHEAHLLRLACDKAATVLGWRPALSAREAIRWTAEWYRAWHAGSGDDGSMAAFSIQQLQTYMSRASRPSAAQEIR